MPVRFVLTGVVFVAVLYFESFAFMAVGVAVGMSVLLGNSMFRMLCFVEF